MACKCFKQKFDSSRLAFFGLFRTGDPKKWAWYTSNTIVNSTDYSKGYITFDQSFKKFSVVYCLGHFQKLSVVTWSLIPKKNILIGPYLLVSDKSSDERQMFIWQLSVRFYSVDLLNRRQMYLTSNRQMDLSDAKR